MKNIMLHIYKLSSDKFKKISSGKLDIDIRPFDNLRKMVYLGDYIEFWNGLYNVRKKVSSMHVFENIDELENFFGFVKLGYGNKSDCIKQVNKQIRGSKKEVVALILL